VIYVPAGARPDRPYRLVFHFHGTYGEKIRPREDGLPKREWVGWQRLEQTLDAAAELQRTRPYNVVLVYPLSAGKRVEPELSGWVNAQYDRMWMRPVSAQGPGDDFARLRREVLALLASRLEVGSAAIDPMVIAEGHSAGGIALRNVAVADPKAVGTYLFLDASFQGWADGCYRALDHGPQDPKVILVVTHNGIADAVGTWKPWCLDLQRDAALWRQHAAFCGAQGGTPAGTELPCEELELRHEAWNESESWCEAAKHDLRGWPGVAVHRTKVRHGDQPRRFTGGLGLPAELAP